MRPAGVVPSPARWIEPPPLPDLFLTRFPRASRPVLHALFSRGIAGEGAEAADRLKEFTNLQIPDPDPFLLKDMDRAVDRILTAIRRDEGIGVFGHFDCDGITSTALLTEALTALGSRVVSYIPGREEEYGIPDGGLERLASSGAGLVVTVDCGARATQHAILARRRSLDLVITDHHHCDHDAERGQDRLPEAIAVVNPQRCDCRYPFKKLAGVGVAYRLAQALFMELGRADDPALHRLLDLVCIGTVGDVVDLMGENRRLVAQGLEALREFRRPGLRCLAGVSRIAADKLTARSVAFGIAPRLNAAQRLRHGQMGLDLLQAATESEAAPIAQELELLNQERRKMTEQAVELAIGSLGEAVDQRYALVAPGLWAAGISGLVASRLREEFGRPALAISLCQADGDTDPECVGSARSMPGFDITRALHAVSHHMVRFGGHAGAAGFTVRRSQIPYFDEAIEGVVKAQLPPELLGPRIEIDGVVRQDDLTPALWEQTARFEPCGQGNPPPLYVTYRIRALPASIRDFSDGGFSFQIPGAKGPVKVSGRGPGLTGLLRSRTPVDLVVRVPTLPGRSEPALYLEDFRPALGVSAPAQLTGEAKGIAG